MSPPQMPEPPCRANPEAFFPIIHEDAVTYRSEVREALEHCGRCPYRAACLEVGLEEDHGVWGGTTPAMRKQLRKRRVRVVA